MSRKDVGTWLAAAFIMLLLCLGPLGLILLGVGFAFFGPALLIVWFIAAQVHYLWRYTSHNWRSNEHQGR